MLRHGAGGAAMAEAIYLAVLVWNGSHQITELII